MQEVIIPKRIPTLALILLACSPTSPNSSVNDGQDSGVPATPDAATRDAGTVDGGSPPATVPNILLLIADDLGADVAPCMAAEPNRVPMPEIEALCDRGLLFTKTWANPMCSPSRATLLTGRYGFRTGVGQLVRGDESPALPLTETTLPNLLKANSGAPYATAAFGKWHVANNSNGGSQHPHTSGFDAYAGLMTGAHRDYYSWSRTENGETQTVDEYSTTRIADDAIGWLGQQTQPWFLWLAFTAPHTPLHAPPDHLHSQGNLPGNRRHIQQNGSRYYGAASEALDREIGRVLAAIGDDQLANTWVIFVGDNGTPGQVVPEPRTRDRAKSTLYEGGIHVPLVIAGPGITAPGSRIDALVNLTDLHRTIAELAGRDSATIDHDRLVDSVSLLPYFENANAPSQRDWIYSEFFGPTIDSSRAGRTIRSTRYKVIRFDEGARALYDLESDPYEQDNLLDGTLDDATQATYDELDAAMIDLTGRR